MIERLQEWDEQLLLTLNGIGHPYLDGIMIFMSAKLVWVPLYAALIYLLYRYYGWSFWKPLILIILAVTIADQFTSSFMKPFFERLRPCKDPSINQVIINVGGCGGKFGFASSHAANTFALSAFFLTLFRTSWMWALIGWAVIVSYSRVYLGVHYPGDILVGGLIGTVLGFLMAKVACIWLPKDT